MIAYIHVTIRDRNGGFEERFYVAMVDIENINIFLGIGYGRTIRMIWLGADTVISFLAYREMWFYTFCSNLHNLRGGV